MLEALTTAQLPLPLSFGLTSKGSRLVATQIRLFLVHAQWDEKSGPLDLEFAIYGLKLILRTIWPAISWGHQTRGTSP